VVQTNHKRRKEHTDESQSTSHHYHRYHCCGSLDALEKDTGMNEWIKRLQDQFAKDYTTTALKTIIIVWSIIVIILALVIDNKWVLAGILAYEVLP